MSSIPASECACGFADSDRRALLTTPGIGPLVVERLEQAGFRSLEQLHQAGPEVVTSAVCALVGSSAWANRRRAIQRVIKIACERVEGS